MDEIAAEMIERLARLRSLPWLEILADARLDQPVEAEPDPAAVIEPYRWLLASVGDGVKLTSAGHLPPALVKRAMTELGWSDDWPGSINRENLTIPVLELRESAQRFGLLRRQKGMLLPTAAGRKTMDDPEALWWHLADRLPDARSDGERYAGTAYLLIVAAGRARDDHLISHALAVCGWVDGVTRNRLTDHDAFSAARDTWALFKRLGTMTKPMRWEVTPEPLPAAVRLARAALLGRDAPSTSRSGPRPWTRTIVDPFSSL